MKNSYLSHRQNLPKFFLITDAAAQGNSARIIAKLPCGSGVIFRDYHIKNRSRYAARIAAICKARRLMLLVAGDFRLALRVKADGVHFPERMKAEAMMVKRKFPHLIVSVAAHGEKTIRNMSGIADVIFLSAVFATESHPEAKPLGPLATARLARISTTPLYALGGVNAVTAKRLKGCKLSGTATIRGILA